jgi:hypothetical protein
MKSGPSAATLPSRSCFGEARAASPLKGRPFVHRTGFDLFTKQNEPPFRGAGGQKKGKEILNITNKKLQK